MRDTTAPVGDDVAAGMKRRTILAGAAWSVPVIAVATASPAFAATTTCPTINTDSSWTRSHKGDTGDGAFDTIDGRRVFSVTTDNTAPVNSGQHAYAWMTTNIQVEAGKTYTFTYDLEGNYGNYSKTTSSPADASWYIDDSRVSSNYGTQPSRTGADTQIPIQERRSDSRPWKTYTFSYKATETKTVALKWMVDLSDRSGSEVGTDDVHVSLPTVSCS
ncbi:MAG: hypothetical protein FJW64_05600 [Actinobacteria bacterium]|nr:hypothetical protein [Actinomycetota bacterium]